jgi:hypothetical protein
MISSRSVLASCLVAMLSAACGSTGPSATGHESPRIEPDSGASPAAAPTCAPPVLDERVDEVWLHVPYGTAVDYDANPPVGGPHFPIWAAYQEFDRPVDRRVYVHDEEHGAIVLLYRCADRSACPEIASALRAVADAVPSDPVCEAHGARVQIVITPDPLLDAAVGAASWGFNYKADCVEPVSLAAFIAAHYGHGRETTCEAGSTSDYVYATPDDAGVSR